MDPQIQGVRFSPIPTLWLRPPYSGTSVADAFIERADQIVIITLLGSVEIGFYYIAVRIPEALIGSISMLATRVMFPVYVSISKDVEHLKRYFLAATKVTGYLAFAAGVGLALVSDLAVQVVFGPEWLPSAGALSILAFCMIGYSLLWSGGDVIKALGKPAYLARITLLHLALIFPIVGGFVLAWHTIEAAALGLATSLVVDNAVKLFVIRRLLHLSSGNSFRALPGQPSPASQ